MYSIIIGRDRKRDRKINKTVDVDIEKQRSQTLPGTADTELSIAIWTLLTSKTKRVSVTTHVIPSLAVPPVLPR